MREILFRGKTEKGEWVYGHYVHQYGAHMIYLPDGTDREYGFDYHHIIPETIGQYTGLTDKNGTKIFEGDIVNIDLFHPKGFPNYEIGYIKYDDTKARFVFCTNEGEYSYDNTDRFEIIGNIHYGPELMRGDNNA